ncbi:leucine-rich repeat protein [Tanacetum coccineum]
MVVLFTFVVADLAASVDLKVKMKLIHDDDQILQAFYHKRISHDGMRNGVRRRKFCWYIPHHLLGNLSNLNVLDLGFNRLMADDFTWVSSLSFLKHLDLSQLEFSQSQNLDKLLNLNMPSLVDLHLSQI